MDPVLSLGLALIAAMVLWTAAPGATATSVGSETHDLRIDMTVPISTAVTPGWTRGDTSVRLPNLSLPGEIKDVSSSGWRMATNWPKGYEVRVRSTTDPALRGRNAVDGSGASAAFLDFSTADACPCPWSGAAYEHGVFGYSATVGTVRGGAAIGDGQWGSSTKQYRGFTTDSYRLFSTPGGVGAYSWDVHFRSMIPEGRTQAEGSYRAGVILSAHPLF